MRIHYRKESLPNLSAALVVFLVALPLCLGIALASGAPLASGLISGIIGGVMVGALSGSAVGVSGPAAGLVVIVLASVEELGSYQAFLPAVILAGVIQILLGFARAGTIARYFPSAVISGMLAGIGILIILKQIPHALGFDLNPEGQLAFLQPDGSNTFSSLSDALSFINPGAVLAGGISLMLLLLWETTWLKQSRMARLPGPLMAVLAGILSCLFLQSFPELSLSADHLVSLPVLAGISEVKQLFIFPDWSVLSEFSTVLKVALTIAVVASLETLLCVEATDKLDPQRRWTPENRELKAQGAGNILAGLLGGLPITQVIVRSSANIQAGSSGKSSAILHGIFLALSILWMAPLMNRIPLASLATVLLVVGYRLASPQIFRNMWKQGPAQFLPFFVTVAGMLLTDLLSGVAIGMAVATASVLFEHYKIPFSSIRRLGRTVEITLSSQVTFLHKASVIETLTALPSGDHIRINGSEASFIHPDIFGILRDFALAAAGKNQHVFMSFDLSRHAAGDYFRDLPNCHLSDCQRTGTDVREQTQQKKDHSQDGFRELPDKTLPKQPVSDPRAQEAAH
ncbi:MAG: SulP family inorganic anion transporter [Deltaproteobacteria bacterium]|nr:SulP family inorganic anion transporter [Deltaproteobacteria bacterium]